MDVLLDLDQSTHLQRVQVAPNRNHHSEANTQVSHKTDLVLLFEHAKAKSILRVRLLLFRELRSEGKGGGAMRVAGSERYNDSEGSLPEPSMYHIALWSSSGFPYVQHQ